jgi:hypothetical protein
MPTSSKQAEKQRSRRSALGGPLTGWARPSKTARRCNRAFTETPGRRPSAAPPRCRPTAALGGTPDNPRYATDVPQNCPGGGIDKSVLAISEPRCNRDKTHLRFVWSPACLVCGCDCCVPWRARVHRKCPAPIVRTGAISSSPATAYHPPRTRWLGDVSAKFNLDLEVNRNGRNIAIIGFHYSGAFENARIGMHGGHR